MNERSERPPLAWWIAVVVTAVWWPVGTYWLSDDFIAVHYASDAGRALSDFAGNQYDLAGVVWFYRPFVSLSFALDVWLGGGAPFVSHLSNAIAHGLAAVLVGSLAGRFAGRTAGWFAAVVWGLSPLHAASVLWAVGRVDSHAVPWILLSVACVVRWCDGARHARIPALIAFGCALATKELAVITPGLVAVTCAVITPRGARWLRVARGTWPFAVVLLAYFGWRWWLFGRLLGGYPEYGMSLAHWTGLAVWCARILNPLLLVDVPLPVQWLGFLPALVGCTLAWRRVPIVLALFVICALPTFQFWPRLENPRNLRYFALASVPLLTLLVAGRAWTAIPALAIAALPHVQIRLEYFDTFAACRQTHEQLLVRAAALPSPSTLFVAGLPVQNAAQSVIAFHFGIDRLLEPPFAGGGHRLFALRPLDPRPGATQISHHTLPAAERVVGWSVHAEQWRELPRAALPTAPVELVGVDRLTTPTLAAIASDALSPAFVMRGVRAPHYRVTMFTPCGYLSCVMPDEASADAAEASADAAEASADAADGRVSVRAWLERGRSSPTEEFSYVAHALRVPIALDLVTRYPVLVEAGEQRVAGFDLRRIAEHLIWVEFDRDYIAFIDVGK